MSGLKAWNWRHEAKAKWCNSVKSNGTEQNTHVKDFNPQPTAPTLISWMSITQHWFCWSAKQSFYWWSDSKLFKILTIHLQTSTWNGTEHNDHIKEFSTHSTNTNQLNDHYPTLIPLVSKPVFLLVIWFKIVQNIDHSFADKHMKLECCAQNTFRDAGVWVEHPTKLHCAAKILQAGQAV